MLDRSRLLTQRLWVWYVEIIPSIPTNFHMKSLLTDMSFSPFLQDDVISKPFRMPELIPKITELVEQYSTRAKAPKAAGNTD